MLASTLYVSRDDLLADLCADLANERLHMATYLYLASAITGPHAVEYREFFEAAAKQELQHVLAFQDRIWGLGGTVPAFALSCTTGRQDGLGGFALQFTVPGAILAAIKLESAVIENYALRLASLDGGASGPAQSTGAAYLSASERAYMKVFYEEQLKDSYEDLEKLRRLRTAAC